MKNELKKNKYFAILYLFFITISVFILLIFSKSEIQIAVNKLNSPFFDIFFKNITYLGTGYLLGVLFIVSLFFNKKFALQVAISSIIMGTVVFLMKSFIFSERPVTYFEYSHPTDYVFHLVKNVQLHHYSSFPSGHTATAFTFFFLLNIFVDNNNKIWQIVFFALALLVGYSRMYLMQHFFIDVVTGSFIGLSSVCISVFIMKKIKNNNNENL